MLPIGAACGMSCSFPCAACELHARAPLGTAYLLTICSIHVMQRALDIMDLMLEVNVQPNIVSYGAAISACARGGAYFVFSLQKLLIHAVIRQQLENETERLRGVHGERLLLLRLLLVLAPLAKL